MGLACGCSFAWCVISSGYAAVSIDSEAATVNQTLEYLPLSVRLASLIMSRHASAHMFPYLHVYVSVCVARTCAFGNL